MLFVDELQLDVHAFGELPDVWIPICTRPSAPPAAGGQAAASPPDDGDSPGGAISHSAWLQGKMQCLDDLSDYDQFYDGWMDHYKWENGCYPKDPRRHFVRTAEHCRRAILAARHGGTPAPE